MRGRKTRSEAFDSRVRARKAQGLSHEQLAAEFQVSRGTITNALDGEKGTRGGRLRPVAKPRAVARKKPAPRAPKTQVPAPLKRQPWEAPKNNGEDLGIDYLRRRLARSLDTLDVLAERARERGDDAVAAQFENKVTLVVKELSRLTPPEPPKPEDNPDIRAAAKQFRQRVHLLIEGALLRQRERSAGGS